MMRRNVSIIIATLMLCAALLALGMILFFPKTPKTPARSCTDKCGDGFCQEVVCLSIGCPCAETPVSCSLDCSANK